jgi:hypothetical protein
MKKKMSVVSSMLSLESEKNPGIEPSRILEISAFLDPYTFRVNTKRTMIANTENVKDTSLPEAQLIPKIWK